MKKILTKSILLVVFFLPLFFYTGKFQTSNSAPSTSVKDQLSSAQLSFFARLGTGNTINNSSIIISTTSGTAPSLSTGNIFVGDTIAIANSTGGGSTIYTVKDIPDDHAIAINTGLGSSNVTVGSYVVATRSAVHTISFTPQSQITGSKWQVLIKATSTSGETHNDGMPDQNGFDLGTLVAGAITCPWSATASIGGTEVISGSSYHSIICSLGAGSTNPINVSDTITIGVGNSMLINPSPNSFHTVGNGDVYTFFVRHLDSAGTLISSDTTQGKIAVTESVRITAIVDPTLTFSIGTTTGITSIGTTLCGYPIGSGAPSTSATSVTFGSLSLSTFNNLAQFLQCTTNASNGYVIQTYQIAPLTMIGGATTIPDTSCPSNACTTDSAAAWTDSSYSGFGYSLQVGSTSVGVGGGSATLGFTSGNYKPFGIGPSNAKTILSRTNTPSATDSLYVCYRVTASTAQPAGTYQNEINYIATATF